MGWGMIVEETFLSKRPWRVRVRGLGLGTGLLVTLLGWTALDLPHKQDGQGKKSVFNSITLYLVHSAIWPGSL